MPVTTIIEYGTEPDFAPVDETGILVTGVEYAPERDQVNHRGSNRAWAYMRFENPRLGITVSGELIADANGAAQGLGNAHPGNSIDLANAADGDDIMGFDIDADNLTVVLNPTRSTSDDSPATISLPALYLPFIAKPAP